MNEEIKCKTHPDAPHGFVRNASHTEDRLVCECEYWEEPKVNERIKQLWEDNDTIEVCYPEQGSPVSVSATTLEKFAELIVRECASELIRWKDEPFPYDPEFGAKLIRKHFGVEE